MVPVKEKRITVDIKDVHLYTKGQRILQTRTQILVDPLNRATVWGKEKDLNDLEQYLNSNYLNKGVDAALIGVFNAKGDRQIGYAVFVESGFLSDFGPSDDE